MSAPRVSVLMTTWNGAALIGASVASVLAQSFDDFELVVVDDGSTDGTVEIVAAIADPRVRLVRMECNGGIVAARNFGFAALRGAYVAALDHDDLADPERLARQVAFLDAHPDVVVVGTEVRINDNGVIRPPDHPRAGDALALRWQLLIDNPLTWSSVMFRAAAVRRLDVFMRGEFEPADDFDFYHRMLGLGEIVRLDEVLTTYRYHGGNASHAAAERLNLNAARVLAGAYAPWFGEGAMEAAVLVIRHLSDRRTVWDRATLVRIGEVIEVLLEGFCAGRGMTDGERSGIAWIAGAAWWRCVRASVRSGVPGVRGVFGGALVGAYRPSGVDRGVSFAVGVVRRVLSGWGGSARL